MVKPRKAVIVAAALGSAVVLAARRATRGDVNLHAVVASMRSSSLPSASIYQCAVGRPMGGFYDLVARETAAILGQGTVLEIGPGPGDLAVRLARREPGFRIIGLDVDPRMVDLATARARREGVADRVTFVVGDVAGLPQVDESIDLVLSTMSFHHWPDPVRSLVEIYRVLRPGGRALIYDLSPWWTRWEGNRIGLELAAQASPFVLGRIEPVRWPGPVRLSRRLTLERPSADPSSPVVPPTTSAGSDAAPENGPG